MLPNREMKEVELLKDRLAELKEKCQNSRSLAEEIFFVNEINHTNYLIQTFYLKHNMKKEAKKIRFKILYLNFIRRIMTNKDLKNWKKYELVRRSGMYNMMVEYKEASKEAKLSIQNYTNILKRYSIIKDYIEKEYGDVDKFLSLKEKDYKKL